MSQFTKSSVGKLLKIDCTTFNCSTTFFQYLLNVFKKKKKILHFSNMYSSHLKLLLHFSISNSCYPTIIRLFSHSNVPQLYEYLTALLAFYNWAFRSRPRMVDARFYFIFSVYRKNL